ncbi:MAG: hypothetical protein PUP93_29490 [Rhizonema sp. NSF051]|nr:hypothetical protein [Rhizonema sp. NSF051]
MPTDSEHNPVVFPGQYRIRGQSGFVLSSRKAWGVGLVDAGWVTILALLVTDAVLRKPDLRIEAFEERNPTFINICWDNAIAPLNLEKRLFGLPHLEQINMLYL